ncbi:hypothetical protein V8Z74_14535 [Comamonas sp. w2-DMI]|uniref:hypothetical protein n=1 Tax=Comamonas sp. w2-DMI TaxID=3126391 RepID=UPI0032E48F93
MDKGTLPLDLPNGWKATAHGQETEIEALASDGRILGSVRVNEKARGYALGSCSVRATMGSKAYVGRSWKTDLYRDALAELQRAIAEQDLAFNFQPGHAIVFAGDIYFIEKNLGDSGQVCEADGSNSIAPFYWCFEGETCRLATEQELRHLPITPRLETALRMLTQG